MTFGWADAGELTSAARAASHDRAAFHALCGASRTGLPTELREFAYWTAEGGLAAIATLQMAREGEADVAVAVGQAGEAGEAPVILRALARLAASLGVREMTTIVSCDRCDPLRVFREAGLAPLSSTFEGSGARVVLNVPAQAG